MEMDRDFEIYHAGPNEPIGKRLHVTFTPQRIIRLNRNAYERFGRPSAVRLAYSRTRDTIWVEAVAPGQPGAFPVIADHIAWRINAAPFCRHFRIHPETTLRFTEPQIEGQTMLLRLHQTVSVARPKRAGKRAKKE